VEGGDPTSIAGLKNDDLVVAWSGDGKQLYLCRADEARPRRVYLFDLATQKRTLWKSLGPADWTGAPAASTPVISSDGKHWAYLVNRSLADLYVVSGLK
jgi:Tol biopolymer transport system component